MKNCKDTIFYFKYNGFIAYLREVDKIDIQYDYELVIESECSNEVKYIKRYEYEPGLVSCFENAYNTIDDNEPIWSIENQCSKKK